MFPVSKKALDFISTWFDKPIIKLNGSEGANKHTDLLYLASMLKMKIHKIFDLMKCPDREANMEVILGDYKYLVIKEVLFSLRDLYETNETRFINKLEELALEMENHLKTCSFCYYQGGYCKSCMQDEILFAYDLEIAYFCNICRNIFHRKCVNVHPCFMNRK